MTMLGRDARDHERIEGPYKVPNPSYVEGGDKSVPGSIWPNKYPHFIAVEGSLEGCLVLCKGCGAILHEDCTDVHADFHTHLEEDRKSVEDARTLTSIIKTVWCVMLRDVPSLTLGVSKALNDLLKEEE